VEHFTPISGTIGGALIGASAAMLWLGLGRIAGISGIVGGLLTPSAEGAAWRVAFIIGLSWDRFSMAWPAGICQRSHYPARPW